jgi:hypothetical protein
MAKNCNFSSSRRQFLTKQLPAGTLMCLGCKSLLAAPLAQINQQSTIQKQKFLLDSGMTVENVFKFTYGYCVPLFKNMEKKIGKDKVIELLKEASAENGAELIKAYTKGTPGSMKSFAEFVKNWLSTPPYDKVITYEITEETDKVFEAKYTECLAAKLYREMGEPEIGFAIECSGSDVLAKTFNPKMEAKSIKNFMKGDDVCIERFTLNS